MNHIVNNRNHPCFSKQLKQLSQNITGVAAENGVVNLAGGYLKLKTQNWNNWDTKVEKNSNRLLQRPVNKQHGPHTNLFKLQPPTPWKAVNETPSCP